MSQIISHFYRWTKIKIRIHALDNKNIYFKERQIWWASLGANIGFEQDGKHQRFERPVLILKKFNRHVLWALPLTSRKKLGKYYYQLEYEGRQYAIILTQLKLISSKRLLRKIRIFPKDEFTRVRELIKGLL